MIEMPENSMIAKPSRLKASTIKKSMINKKNSPKKQSSVLSSDSSPKRLPKDLGKKKSEEEKVINDAEFHKIKDDIVRTRILGK